MIKKTKMVPIKLDDQSTGFVNSRGLQIDLSIVIPVFNKFQFTKSCLEDLKHLPLNHEIIVVDNASSDETQTELEKLVDSGFNFIYIRNDENYGFGKACSIGYSVSNGSNVMFLNNDIRVKSNRSNWTNEIIKLADEGLIGPTMGQLDDQLSFVQEANKLLTGNSYMSGWCITASKKIWEKLEIAREPLYIDDTYIFQIFSEEFFCYFEDTDLSFRARKLGIPMKLVEIPVVHFGKISSKQLNTSKLYNDSRKIFINKWKNKVPK